MTFTVLRDPLVGEEVWLATTPAGLPLRVLPRPRFRETAAVISFGYGSVDLEFDGDAGRVTTPPGTAHYLEHKLFEDEELAVFQRFAARGARVNAQTGFTRTSYHFQATSHVRDNLADLLRLVSHPHITQENVDKERGIIAQEVRMYEDSPDHGTMFDLLGCLFPAHPVRHTVGGTVESIGAITPAVLLASHRAYYRTGNAALAVAGPVDPQEVFDLACACALPSGSAPADGPRLDQGPLGAARCERPRQVARPRLLLGIKDHEPAVGWRQRAMRAACTGVVLDRLFGPGSDLREALHRSGEVDDTLSAFYLGERSFALAAVACESEAPELAEAALRRLLRQPVECDEEHLERVRRRQLGAFVRGCESVRALAFAHAGEQLDGAPPFHGLEILRELTPAAVQERASRLLDEHRLAVAVSARPAAQP